MLKELRKARRRPMRYAAWIALKPGELHGCALSDISETGARIDVEDSKKIPNRFMLFLSRGGAARRMCNVVWRKPKQIGVTFATRLIAADRINLVPTAGHDVASPPLVPEDGVSAEPAENT